MVFFNETNFVCTIIIKIFIQIYNETVNYELKSIKEEIILIMIKTIFFFRLFYLMNTLPLYCKVFGFIKNRIVNTYSKYTEMSSITYS